MKELEKYQVAFKAALDVLNSARRQINDKSGCGYLADAITRDIVTLENMVAPPPPEMEEVEVVRWMCRHCEKVWPGDTVFEPCCGSPLVKLTGTLQRPKPHFAEKEARIKFFADPSTAYLHMGGDSLPVAEFIGTLTWTEDPK